MAIKDENIWNDRESTCFEYLKAAIGGEEGVDGTRGSMPDGVVNVWFFAMQGGGEPIDLDINSNVHGGCGKWVMNAMLEARMTARADAQKIGSIVRIALPTEDEELDGIQWFKPIGTPSLIQGEDVDMGEGELVQTWELKWPLEVCMVQNDD